MFNSSSSDSNVVYNNSNVNDNISNSSLTVIFLFGLPDDDGNENDINHIVFVVLIGNKRSNIVGQISVMELLPVGNNNQFTVEINGISFGVVNAMIGHYKDKDTIAALNHSTDGGIFVKHDLSKDHPSSIRLEESFRNLSSMEIKNNFSFVGEC